MIPNINMLLQFRQYLEENNVDFMDETDYSDLSAVDIFTKYSDEFEDYLKEQQDKGNVSIFDKQNGGTDFDSLLQSELGLSMADLNDLQGGQLGSNGNNTNNTESEYLEILSRLEGNEEFKSSVNLKDGSDIPSEAAQQLVPQNNTGTIPNVDASQQVSKSNKSGKCNLNAINNLNVKLSDTDVNVINKLFGLNSNDTSSADKQSHAEQLFSSISGDKLGLTSDKVQVLQKYVSELSALKFSDDEIVQSIKNMDGDPGNLTAEDFKMLAEHIKNGTLPQTIEEGVEAGILPNSAQTDNQTPGHGPNAPASAKTKINNMSIEDLKAELDKAKTAFDEKLKEADSELAKEKSDNDEKLKVAQEQSADYDDQIKTNKMKIVHNQSLISNNNSTIAGLQSQLTQIKDASENASAEGEGAEGAEASGEDYALQSQNIQSQIDALNEQNEQLQQEIDKLNEENRELETKKAEQDALVTQYTQEATRIEGEISTIATTNTEVAEAKAYIGEVQAMYDKRVAEKEKADKVDILDVNKNSKDLRNSDDLSNLPLTYELGGKTYHCPKFASYDTDGDGVDDFTMDSWEEFQRYALNAGICNVGAYGSMQCQNAAAWYMEFALGVADMSIIKEMKAESEDPNYGNKDTAGLMTTKIGDEPGKNQRFITQVKGSRDETYEVIVNELKNGRPCVVSVPGASSSHYILAVGISDDGDILVMDSYNCTMEKLGFANSEAYKKGDRQHRNLANANGVMIFSNGHTLQYGKRGDYITQNEYWTTCDGDVDYRTYLAICRSKDQNFVQKRYPELFAKYGYPS